MLTAGSVHPDYNVARSGRECCARNTAMQSSIKSAKRRDECFSSRRRGLARLRDDPMKSLGLRPQAAARALRDVGMSLMLNQVVFRLDLWDN